MRRLRLRWLFGFSAAALALACGEDANPEDVGKSCVVGTQVECACPGSTKTGVQVCNADGHSFGPCAGCSSGSGGVSGAGGWATGGTGATGGSAGVGGSGGSPSGGSGG